MRPETPAPTTATRPRNVFKTQAFPVRALDRRRPNVTSVKDSCYKYGDLSHGIQVVIWDLLSSWSPGCPILLMPPGEIRMKQGLLSKILFLSHMAAMTYACGTRPSNRDSSVQGIIPTKNLGKMAPQPKNPTQLSHFRKGMVSAFDKYHALSTSQTKYKSLQKSLYSAIEESAGLPRTQIENVMEVLVSPSTTACGGASCARVFGLTQDEIVDFLDKSKELIAKTPIQTQKEKNALRDLLIASLTHEDDIAKSNRPIKEVLTELGTVTPTIIPRPKATLTLKHPKEFLTDAETQQIQEYCHMFSTQIRVFEAHHVENLLRAGYSPQSIQTGRARVALINHALAKLPPVPGTTYRGIGNISESNIADLFRFRRSKQMITLGQRNLQALTSTSWNIRVAEAFAASTDKSKYSIIYTIKQRSGKTVEKLSRYPGEEEVLIPSDALFQIGEIAFLNREKRLLSVELIEYLKTPGQP